MSNFLGIIGGVGPLASAYFYELLTNMTDASKDQEHINTVIFSHATIPDRTAYLLKESKENPYPILKEDVKKLSELGASLLFIPCNTSCYFHEKLQKETEVPILNMVEDTVEYLKKQNKQKVMILATTGTIKTNLYQKACEKKGLNYIVPNEEIQNKVMHIIYNNIKAGKEVEKEVWESITKHLKEVDACIMGCTELSIVKGKLSLESLFIDPLEIEAKKIIQFFNKKEKEIN